MDSIDQGEAKAKEIRKWKAAIDGILWSIKREIFLKDKDVESSKFKSAVQYIRRATLEIGMWATTLAVSKIEKSKSDTDHILKNAITDLKQTESWAREIFSDAECDASLRIKAFELQLFCAPVVFWEDPKRWFYEWERIFESFFKDTTLAQTALGTSASEQEDFLTKSAKANVSEVRVQMFRIITSMELAIHHVVQEDSSLTGAANVFSEFMNEKLKRKKSSVIKEWPLYSESSESMSMLIASR